MRYDFKVGDKVARDRDAIGRITSISSKEHVITVDYKTFTEKYDVNGLSFGYGFKRKRIEPLTKEVVTEIDRNHTVKKCRDAIADVLSDKKKLNHTQAAKILEVLNERDRRVSISRNGCC